MTDRVRESLENMTIIMLDKLNADNLRDAIKVIILIIDDNALCNLNDAILATIHSKREL
jgi:hypothetical protein